MTSDEKADRVQDLAVGFGGAALGAVPIFGGLFAWLLHEAAGSAVDRRRDQILAQLRTDLNSFAIRHGAAALALFDDEDFTAAMHRTLRELLEAESEAKRRLLRAALLGDTAVPSAGRARYVRTVAALLPAHVTLLRWMADAAPDASQRHPSGSLDGIRDLDSLGEDVSLLVDELVSVGLLARNVELETRPDFGQARTRADVANPRREVVMSTTTYRVTGFALDFLSWIAAEESQARQAEGGQAAWSKP